VPQSIVDEQKITRTCVEARAFKLMSKSEVTVGGYGADLQGPRISKLDPCGVGSTVLITPVSQRNKRTRHHEESTLDSTNRI
jgi:hypothetical protein